jgi:hypothetical protein
MIKQRMERKRTRLPPHAALLVFESTRKHRHSIFCNGSLGFFPNHNSYGVVSTDLDGALFKVNAAVSNA